MKSKESFMGNLLLKSVLIFCAITLFGSNLAYACSGKFAGEGIRANERLAFTYGIIGIFIVVSTIAFYFLRHKKGLPIVIVSILVLALHPGWTNGARMGDCGTSVISGAIYFTTALTIGLTIQLLLYFRNRFYKKLNLK